MPSQEAFESLHRRGVINLFMMPMDRSVFDGQWFIEYAAPPLFQRIFVTFGQVQDNEGLRQREKRH